MSENYIVINGKKAELTKEQLKALGIEVEKKRKNPFDRVANDTYFCITADNKASSYTDDDDGYTRIVYNAVNYFNDEQFANQVALHQLLYRKLLKFSYDNECEDTAEWDNRNTHWYIFYDLTTNLFDTGSNDSFKNQGVYFSSSDGARAAIYKVVEPFVKEHPEFIW